MKEKLARYLRDHLPESTKAQMNSQAVMDVVHCVVDFIKHERMGLSITDKAREVSNIIEKSQDVSLKRIETDADFMDELGKL